MSPLLRDERLLAWLGLFTLAVAGRVQAQPRMMEEEPQLFTFHYRDASLLLDVEDRVEKNRADDTRNSSRRDTFYLSPSLRVSADGSVYHPNLLSYEFYVREGLSWEDQELSGTTDSRRDGRSVIQDYDTRITLLQKEPYAVKLFASRHDLYRDYDFFTRVKVDSQRVGGSAGYQDGKIPFLVTASHSEQDVDDEVRPSSLDEDAILVTAQNRRDEDRTDLRYSFNEFQREEEGVDPVDGWRQLVRLSDTERFGTGDLSSLHSAASYNRYESPSSESRYADAQEGLILQHSKTLRSHYNYAYNDNRSDSVSGNNQYGRAAVEHQLYESLNSSAGVHGRMEENEGGDSSLETRTYGTSLDENYVKRLSTWGRLRLGYHGQLDRRTQDGAGTSIAIIGESHVLRDGTPIFLNQPFAQVSSIVVQDQSGAVTYREGLDYRVFQRGSQVELQRVVGGTIPDGATVRVDYTADAPQEAQYDTRTDSGHVRVELLHDVLGIYARIRQVDNEGDRVATAEDLTDKTVGADVSWGWLHAGAEYEDYDSNLTPFRASRLFQSLNCPLTDWTSVGVSARQTRYTYRDPERERETYEIIGRYHVRVTTRLGVGLEGGVFDERGEGYDRRLNTYRSNVDFALGQLSMRLNCELEDETHEGGSRERRIINLNARRSF